MTISFRKTGKYLIAIAISLVVIFGIGQVQKQLDRRIEEDKLFFTGVVNNAPPVVAFTTMALGSFRGIIADLLWLRAASLQDDKNYFEMVQLANWIVKLQPRFAGATVYLGWNMAYNISVTCSLWQDRWYWVWEGIKLIRDDALLYNPGDAKLYWELAVIFQQKLGNVLDDANYYYKSRLADEMMQIIGINPDWEYLASCVPEDDTDFNVKRFEPFFMKRYPADSPIWAAARKINVRNFAELYEKFRVEMVLDESLVNALDNLDEAKRLDGTLRVIWLYDKYRLNARTVRSINLEYGEIDWRLSEAQALYWANEGIRIPKSHDMQCSRLIANSLQAMVQAGRIMIVDVDGYSRLILAPNLDLVMSAVRTYDWAYEEVNNRSFQTAKINFMKNACIWLFMFGRYNDTKEVFAQLKEADNTVKYPPFEDFFQRELKEIIETQTYKQITDIIHGFIRNALTAAVEDNQEALETYESLAKKTYIQYQESISGDREKGRRGLAPYNEIRDEAVKQFLSEASPEAAALIRSRLNIQAAERTEEAEKPETIELPTAVAPMPERN